MVRLKIRSWSRSLILRGIGRPKTAGHLRLSNLLGLYQRRLACPTQTDQDDIRFGESLDYLTVIVLNRNSRLQYGESTFP